MKNWLLIASEKHHPDDVVPNVVVPVANETSDPFVFAAMKLNLQVQAIRPRFERMNGNLAAEYAYDELFRRLWKMEEPFILVEHDILPWPGALLKLWQCPEPWCAHQYFIHGELRAQLGCVKFDPARLGECPVPEELVSWTRLDWTVISTLANRGHVGHLHEPPVSHLNYAHQRVISSLVLHS